MNETETEVLRRLTQAAYAVTNSEEAFGFTYADRLEELEAAAEEAADVLTALGVSIDPDAGDEAEENTDLCECGAPTDDGEGYDGKCGNCADREEKAV